MAVPGQVIALAIAGVALAVVVGVVRWLLVRRALAGREPICVLVPADTFDPSPEAVVRFAAERLARVPRLVGARRAGAVRIRLGADRAGALTYRLEAHRSARSTLADGGYREVEVVRVIGRAEPESSGRAA